METTGTIKVIQETQVVSDKFRKREFVLTTEGTTPYPQHVSFQVTQDKCDLLDTYQVGQSVKVQFNLRGREWNGPQGVKYFNTLEAWKLESVLSEPNPVPLKGNDLSPVFKVDPNNNDDLPF